MRAEIISITFTSGICYYCENPWKYRLEVAIIDSKSKELTGDWVDIYACQHCRDTKMKKIPEDRIKEIIVRSSDETGDKQ